MRFRRSRVHRVAESQNPEAGAYRVIVRRIERVRLFLAHTRQPRNAMQCKRMRKRRDEDERTTMTCAAQRHREQDPDRARAR